MELVFPSVVELLLLEETQLLKKCKIQNTIGTGKGGQKRNKTKNAVRVIFFSVNSVDSISVTSSKYRSKQENLTSAWRKLKIKIAVTKNSQLTRMSQQEISLVCKQHLKSYFLDEKIKINSKNFFYPLLLAVIFDCFFLLQKDLKKVAEFLGVTFSQLQKFILKDKNLVEVLKN